MTQKQVNNQDQNGNCAKPLLANRLLKFRAWDNDQKEWYKPIHEAFKGNLWELMISFSGDLLAHTIKGVSHESTFKNKYEVNQFTGLIDKNGKEIYEGDLILDEEYDDDGNDISSNSQVLFDNETSQYVVDNSYAKTRTSLVSIVNYIGIENLQVIGNIYENPELLFTPIM